MRPPCLCCSLWGFCDSAFSLRARAFPIDMESIVCSEITRIGALGFDARKNARSIDHDPFALDGDLWLSILQDRGDDAVNSVYPLIGAFAVDHVSLMGLSLSETSHEWPGRSNRVSHRKPNPAGE